MVELPAWDTIILQPLITDKVLGNLPDAPLRAVGEWKSINGCSRFADFGYALNKDSWTSPCASRSEKREDRDKRSGFEAIARPHYSVAALVAAVLRRDSDLNARFESAATHL
jgi:hypothetical protein